MAAVLLVCSRSASSAASRSTSGSLIFSATGQDGQVVDVLAVADTVKDDAADVVGRLHAMGLQVAMITGDNARTAAAIAKTARLWMCSR